MTNPFSNEKLKIFSKIKLSQSENISGRILFLGRKKRLMQGGNNKNGSS